ncbi:MAG: flagellar hook-length control protein FliK [Gallionellaceae bacterium]|nr:flagellar hook-length control protein FliK [Gallionellaceae bacterium]
MPNLAITNASSAVQTQAPTLQGNSNSQAAEAFGSLLARQQANQESADGSQAAALPADSTPAESGDARLLHEALEMEQDIASLVLAGLLRPAVRAEGNAKVMAETGETDDLATHELTGADVRPESVLASMMMPAGAEQKGNAVLTPGTIGEGDESKGMQQVFQSLIKTQGNSTIASSDTGAGAIRGEIFQAALETSGRGAASSAQFLDGEQASVQVLQGDAFSLTSLPQNGVALPVSSHSVAVQSRLDTPLANNAWAEEFSQKIVWMATQREQTAELHLNPPQLGPLEVVISVSDDQATAVFASQHAAVRQAVEQALPRLRDMLADSGITLGNATVSDQLPREQQAAHDGRQQNGTSWPAGTSEIAMPVSHHQPGMVAWAGRRHEGMVDTFA